MNAPDNPAARLNDILSDGLERFATKPLRAQKAAVAWGELLGLAGSDTSTLLAAYARVVSLPDEIRAAVDRNHELDAKHLLEKMPVIESMFASLHLQHNWQHFEEKLDPTTMYSLRGIASALHAAEPQRTLSDENLADLEAIVDDLDEILGDSTLPVVLRQFARHAAAIRFAIQQYRIVGCDQIEYSLSAATGEMFALASTGKVETDETSKSGRAWKATIEKLRDAMVIIAFWDASRPLLGNAVKDGIRLLGEG